MQDIVIVGEVEAGHAAAVRKSLKKAIQRVADITALDCGFVTDHIVEAIRLDDPLCMQALSAESPSIT